MSITQQQSLSAQHNNNGRVPKLQATLVVVVSLAQRIMFGCKSSSEKKFPFSFHDIDSTANCSLGDKNIKNANFLEHPPRLNYSN
jgi:hypothetical protein